MNSKSTATFWFILFWVMTLLFIIMNIQYSYLKEEAIFRNLAEYNSTNGVWQWKDK